MNFVGVNVDKVSSNTHFHIFTGVIVDSEGYGFYLYLKQTQV